MNEAVNNRPRKPWLAVLLSWILPGFGHLYVGKVRSAALIFLAALLALGLMNVIALAMLPSHLVQGVFVVASLFVLVWYIFLPAMAYREAKKGQVTYALAPCNRWYYYLLFFLVSGIVDDLATKTMRNHWLEPYVAPTESMAPTLIPGDRFYADKRIDSDHPNLKHGDLVIFLSLKDLKTVYVKRIIGLPGDHIQIRKGEVTLNNQPLQQSDLGSLEVTSESTHPGSHIRMEHVDGKSYPVAYSSNGKVADTNLFVPNHSVFLLGDNRGNSYDSRAYGPVPMSHIKGKPIQIWFSKVPGAFRFRWERIGKLLN